jgi:hypothetical protein
MPVIPFKEEMPVYNLSNLFECIKRLNIYKAPCNHKKGSGYFPLPFCCTYYLIGGLGEVFAEPLVGKFSQTTITVHGVEYLIDFCAKGICGQAG